MLRLGVTQEWVGEGELLRERTKNQIWRRPYDVLAEATHREVVVRVHHTRIWLLGAPLWCITQQEEWLWIQGVNVVVPQRRVFVCASELALDESLSHQHMGAVYHQGRSQIASTSESHGGDLIIQRCKAIDSRAMGLAAPRYRRGETSMESSIPCSHRGKALVVKGGQGGEECKGKLQVPRQGERAEAKEFHKIGVDGLLIKIAESGDFGLMQECSTKERSREYVVLYLSTQRSKRQR
ncbi:hypothetical protein BHE74_00039660 [Ensete ventricosum]|nr:hypothetical protein BHE74_00039660 [Ensete ventricosum]